MVWADHLRVEGFGRSAESIAAAKAGSAYGSWRRDPERSRFLGAAKDLACRETTAREIPRLAGKYARLRDSARGSRVEQAEQFDLLLRWKKRSLERIPR